MKLIHLVSVVALLATCAATFARAAELAPTEAREIAKKAYVYGFPVVESYKTLYAQAVDHGGPDFKAPFNQIGNTARVLTPKDTAFVTPNSDTPYSFVWMEVDNALNRYLINSPVLPQLKTDADGGLTLYVQYDSPGADKESNWLPAPNGSFYMVMRIYLPQPEVISGEWKAPPLQAVN